jgi:low affinity Fe/Cu permease
VSGVFGCLARRTTKWTGSPSGFLLAFAVVVVWACWGPFVGYSETWQLLINTGTTIVTFLMVFLIQNTQNRDSEALHAKVDAMILANEKISNRMAGIEKED